MQERAAAAIYGPRVIGGERHDVTRHARWVVEIDVGQTFPAAADTDDLAFVFSAAIHHTLYDHVQTRDVATAGENSDAFVRHDRVPSENGVRKSMWTISGSNSLFLGIVLDSLSKGQRTQGFDG